MILYVYRLKDGDLLPLGYGVSDRDKDNNSSSYKTEACIYFNERVTHSEKSQ